MNRKESRSANISDFEPVEVRDSTGNLITIQIPVIKISDIPAEAWIDPFDENYKN